VDQLFKQYEELLYQYVEHKQEKQLYKAQQVSKEFIKNNMSPEHLLLFHLHAMKKKYNLPSVWDDSFQFLLDFMVYYGLAYQERTELLSAQKQLGAELMLAASVQQSILPDLSRLTLPEGLEIGVVNVAAREVSGDFHNIFPYGHGVQFGVADVSGKSMPAAILMSMIKFAMDTMIDEDQKPHVALNRINRFVHDNSDPSMFVTMFWGDYNMDEHCFYYSSAGHEPSLLYRAKNGQFADLSTDGNALGLTARSEYRTEKVPLEPGDMVLLYTDGLIEQRDSLDADDNELLRRLVREVDLTGSAQEIVEQIHEKILQESALEIDDDQTLLLFRRTS
jgi:sigma-B regulation protein RsbU (phosphoserine phosphatase)